MIENRAYRGGHGDHGDRDGRGLNVSEIIRESFEIDGLTVVLENDKLGMIFVLVVVVCNEHG